MEGHGPSTDALPMEFELVIYHSCYSYVKLPEGMSFWGSETAFLGNMGTLNQLLSGPLVMAQSLSL